MLGCYTFPRHVGVNHPELPAGIDVPTFNEALRAEPTGAVFVDDPAAADVCLAVVGDRSGLFGRGSSGEGCDAEDLELPYNQGELLDKVIGSGTPTVIVVLSGRPYALGRWADRAAAVVQAFFPGQEGGGAVAGVLSGRVEPSGRLRPSASRAPRAASPPPISHHRWASTVTRATSTQPPSTRSGTACRTPRSPGTPRSATPPNCPPTARPPCASLSATPATAPAPRSSSSTSTTRSARSHGRRSGSSATPGSRSTPGRRRRSTRRSRPTSPRTPAPTAAASSNPEPSNCALPRPAPTSTTPCRSPSRGRFGRSGTGGGCGASCA